MRESSLEESQLIVKEITKLENQYFITPNEGKYSLVKPQMKVGRESLQQRNQAVSLNSMINSSIMCLLM